VNRSESLEGCCRATIAIIGGGFTGAILSVHLLRKSADDVSIVLVERGPLPGRGVAYGTQIDGHLLNVRARNMSAYPDAPDHFVKWAQTNYSSSATPGDFLPRSLYGQYVVSQLREARESHPGKLHSVRSQAVSLERVGNETEIRLASGETIIADKVVLALGHFPPGELSFLGEVIRSSRYVPNPWSPNFPSDANHDKNVLLIGSGLTSVDTVIELRARGFAGTIHILSRRGLLPQSHRVATPFPLFWNDDSPRTVRGLLRKVHEQIKVAEAEGSNWRAVIDSLRPVTQDVWRSLPLVEQRRFLRHLRTYWDVHRHRIAEQIGEEISAQLRDGKIRVHAGRVAACKEDTDGVTVAYRDRASRETRTIHVDRVVNCTGPESDYRRVGSPLLSDLIHKKLARPDALSLGLDVADDGALLNAQGLPSDFLYTLGPLRKGGLWESIAVPELRVQISDLADVLLRACAANSPSGGNAMMSTEISVSGVHS
jgi:uncharacterized NAD(P)/FAD-binding protein YdhS